MPIYPVTNKKTGKTYDMPWEDDTNPPTTMDAMKFIDEQEKPTGWNKLNKIRSTPLTDYLPDSMNPSKLSDKYIKPITEEGMAHPEGVMGKVKKYGGAFAESLADVGSQSTRPDMLAIMAATGGAGKAASMGYGRTAAALATPGGLLAGKMGAEGLKEAYDAPDLTGKVVGGTKALLGAAGAAGAYGLTTRGTIPKGLRDISDKPFGPQLEEFARPNKQTGLSTQRVRPNYSDAEIVDPTEQISAAPSRTQKALPPAGPPGPPEPPIPESIAPQGLPPKSRVFYAGEQGPASTNINEPPTRTFAGGQGATPPDQFKPRGWSAAQAKLKPSAPMQDVTPAQNWRDILEQNSPYGRILRGEDFTSEQPARVSPPAAPVGMGSVVEPPVPEGHTRLYRGDYYGKEPLTADRLTPRNQGRIFTSQRSSAESYTHPNIQDYLQADPATRSAHPEGKISYVDLPSEKIKPDFAGNDVNQLNPYDAYTLTKKQAKGARPLGSVISDEGLAKPAPGGLADWLKNKLSDEEGAVKLGGGGLTGKRTGDAAAAKLNKIFTDRAKKLQFGLEDSDAALPGVQEAPAQKMPLRQKLGDIEMKARGKLAGIMGDETGAITLKSEMPQKGAVSSLKNLFTSKEAPPSEDVQALRKDNHVAAKDWSTQRAASKQHGQFEAENFTDLKPAGLGPINDYIAGDRSGKLAAVDKWVDNLHKQETDANVTNLDRKAFAKKIFEPKFVGKDGVQLPPKMKVPSTYEEGQALGLNPKYNDMAELIGDRTRRSKLAIANKKFDNYLEASNQKRPIRIDDANNPQYAQVNSEYHVKPTIQGPDTKTLLKHIHDVHSSGNEYANVIGNAVAKTKNLSLAGGIPKTPLNIHGANIGRSMFQVMGKEGVANFAKGIASPSWLESESTRLKPLVREALDYGYQHTAGEADAHGSLSKWLAKYPITDYLNKGMKWEEKWFEDPLFKKALPAWKAQVLEARVNDLTKSGRGLTREQVLRKASEQANDFMGGQNTTLRNKTAKSLGHTLILAPDWAESQLNRAVKGYKAVAGKEDPIYRDALLRSAGMRGAALAAQAGLGQDRGDKPSDLTTVGLGKTASGRFREGNVLGTASEGVRIPEIAIRSLLSGNLKPVAMMGKDRTAIPAQSFINLLESMDSYGNPMTGEDKYGRPIPFSTTLKNYADEATKPLQPQQMQAIVGLARGKIGPEEAFSQSAELPIKYAAPQRFGQRARVRSRRR